MKQDKAGWGSIEITPPLGLAMGGRGARFAPGETVLDPLLAQVTLLEDSRRRRLALVSLDLIEVGQELASSIQWSISQVAGMPPESVLVNCSHTHAGPMTHWSKMASLEPKPREMQEYEQELEFRVTRAASEALRRLAPARVSWHEGTCDVGINRRLAVDGVVGIRPNPAGAYNRELTVIRIQTDGGRAVIFWHGCHPVIVYGFNWTGISAEWPGRARGFVREALGEGTHVQFLQGLAGDVRPRVLADVEAKSFRKSRPEDVDIAGRTASDAVLATLERDKGDELALDLRSVAGIAMMESEEGDPLEEWLKKVNDPDELTRNNARYWAKRLEGGAAPNTHVPWGVGLATLTDDHRIAWISGEPLSQWLEVLRESAGARKLIALGYTQAGQGYLPRDRHLAEGGYEITRSRAMGSDGPGQFKPGLDQSMRLAFQRLTEEIARR